MDSKFFDSLFEGDSPNGCKLGMGLTGGDFWPRIIGCQNLYRGASLFELDDAAIVAVYDVDDKTLTVSCEIVHEPGKEYFYILRRANSCGVEEQSICACVVIAFDQDGNLVLAKTNTPVNLEIRQVGSDALELSWYYCPLDQSAECKEFSIYSDAGTGQIDYSSRIATTPYIGARQYKHRSNVPLVGTYMFAVRAFSIDGIEDDHGISVAVGMIEQKPQSVQNITIKQI